MGRTRFKTQTVSLALLASSTSLLPGSKHLFLNPKDSSYLYLLPSLMVFFFCILFRIMQHRDNKANETVCVLKRVRPIRHYRWCLLYLIPLLKNTYSRYSHLQITINVATVNVLFLQLVSN
jgi:hypothetical protein